MALEPIEPEEPGYPEPLNIGNPNEFTIRQLAEKVIELTCSPSKIVFHPLPTDYTMQRQPDISRAKKHLGGWEPKVQLEEGLKKTTKYFDDLLIKGA